MQCPGSRGASEPQWEAEGVWPGPSCFLLPHALPGPPRSSVEPLTLCGTPRVHREDAREAGREGRKEADVSTDHLFLCLQGSFLRS